MPDDPAPTSRGVVVLLALATGWLAATLWSTHTAISGPVVDEVSVSAAALALPGVVAACLLAGAAAGLAATRRWPARPHRWLIALSAGVAAGLGAALALTLGYGSSPRVLVIAATFAVAGGLGGVAARLPPPVLAAGIGATLAAFAAGVALAMVQAPAKALLGAAGSVSSLAVATFRFGYLTAAMQGLVAGLAAYGLLRWQQRNLDTTGTAGGVARRGISGWPGYLVAGAAPGLMALTAMVLARAGGWELRAVVRGLSPADAAVLAFVDAGWLRTALVVAFVGGITAMIMIGRTISPLETGSRAADRPDAAPLESGARD